MYAGIASFKDKYIFLIGGMIDLKITGECSYYKIDEDYWLTAPDLKKERYYSSCCQLGEFIYTIGGTDRYKEKINSIERLNAKEFCENRVETE